MGDRGRSWNSAVVRATVVSGPLLGLAALAMLRWADWGASRDPDARGGTSELAIWQFLITASVITWTVLAAVGLRLIGELANSERWRERERTRRFATGWFVAFVYVAIAVVLAAGGIAGLRNPYVMEGQDWKIPILHLIAGAANVPLLVCLKRIQLEAVDESRWSTAAADIARLGVLRRSTRHATAALGGVIALAVITTGALSQATEAAGLTPLPGTFTVVYGAWFTAVVAAAYLYVHGALEARGRWILDQAAPALTPSPDSADAFAKRRGLRSEVAQELELGGDARGNLEGLLAVFAPLIGALLSQLGGL